MKTTEEILYAIQWQDPQDENWQLCFRDDDEGRKQPCIYLYEKHAESSLYDWLDAGENYRIIEVTLKETQ